MVCLLYCAIAVVQSFIPWYILRNSEVQLAIATNVTGVIRYCSGDGRGAGGEVGTGERRRWETIAGRRRRGRVSGQARPTRQTLLAGGRQRVGSLQETVIIMNSSYLCHHCWLEKWSCAKTMMHSEGFASPFLQWFVAELVARSNGGKSVVS